MPEGPQRVFVHIGPPKTGTTYLQSVLWANRRRLRRQGILLPGATETAHFAAAADIRGRRPAGGTTVGAWDRLAAEVREWPGTSVVSCEWFAFAPAAQVDRLVETLAPLQVHLVVTLRDLGRIVPAVWQEQVKNGRSFTMTEFLAELAHPVPDSYGELFWRVHDTRALLDRWEPRLPRERIHLVTLPTSGAAPDELWNRFAGLFSPRPQVFDTSTVKANPGLGPAEAELLRQVNAELGGRLRKKAHSAMVKNLLTDHLVEGSPGGRILLPAHALPKVAAHAEEVVTELRERGYDVAGTLDDLAVGSGTGATMLPEDSTPDDVRRAAVASIGTLLITMQRDGAHRRRIWRGLGLGAARGPRRSQKSEAAANAAPAGSLVRRVAVGGRRAASRALRAVSRS